jgi:hypothetical protein
MRYAVFWDVMPCGSCKKLCFGGKYRLRYQSENQQDRNKVTRNSLDTANLVPNTLLLNVGSYESHIASYLRRRHSS